MALKIKKVLNSSVVLAMDNVGAESIVLGKGIGYNAKRGEIIPRAAINQLFVPLRSQQETQVLELLESIDPMIVDLTTEIVQTASKKMAQALAPGLSFALMDHIAFAIQRLKSGLNIQNKLYWEVQTYYPVEFSVAEQAVALINDKLDVTLPKTEVANIAFHLINAEQGEHSDYDSLKVTEFIDDLVSLIRYQAKRDLAQESISYQRLITHVKFFADRLFTDQQLMDSDDVMFNHVQTTYPQASQIGNQICAFIQRRYGLTVSDAEYLYLVVHIARNIN